MLTLTPINLKMANAFVQQHHRHHKPTRGHKFSIGVSDNGALVGVAICGRPVARRLDDGYTLEVNRLCTNGTPNACSILYAAAYRAARAMGYNKVIGMYELVVNDKVQRENINSINYFRDDKLVQQAISDMEKRMAARQQSKEQERSNTKKSVLDALRSLKAKKQEQPAQKQDKPKKAKTKGMEL